MDRQNVKNHVNRILLCRSGGIGDVIQTLPLVKYLRTKYKTSNIEYLTSGEIAKLLESYCPYIDKVWVFDKNKQKQLVGEMLNYRSSNIDYFFNLHNSLTFFLFNLFYVRAKRFFQYRKNYNYHVVVNYAKIYDSSISEFDLESKTLFVTKESTELLSFYGFKNGKYICLVPGVGKARPHRAWLLENWLALSKQLTRINGGYKIAILGGKDQEKSISVLFNVGDDLVNLVGKLSLNQTLELMSSSFLVVSCDTGMLHLASALGKKVISLFGPTDPNRFGPFTFNSKIISAKDCHCIGRFKDSKECKIGKHNSTGFCMSTITVENVLSSVQKLLNEEVDTYYGVLQC